MLRNTASQTIGAQMVSASDGSAFTGTVSAHVTGDGGTQGAGSGTVTHRGNGYHSYTITQAETDFAHVAVTFTGTGAVPATVQVYTRAGDAFTRLGAPAGASIAADVAAVKTQTAAIETDTQDIQSRLPAALVSGRIDASVGAIAANAITAAATATDFGTEVGTAVWASTTRVLTAGTNIVLAKGTGVTGFTDLSAAQVNAEVDTAITDAALATAANLATVDTVVDGIKAVTDKLDTALELDGSVYRYTVNALEQAPSGTGASASAIADEVQTRTIAAVTLVNGLAANSVTASALASDAVTEIQSGLATAAALATVDTVVDAILVDTTEIGAAGAGLTAVRLSATGVDDILDEVVEGSTTLRQSVRLANAALGGKASGLGTTTVTFRNLADDADRITATVTADGDRTSVSRDLS